MSFFLGFSLYTNFVVPDLIIERTIWRKNNAKIGYGSLGGVWIEEFMVSWDLEPLLYIHLLHHLFPLTVTWGWDQPMAFNITHWCLQLFFTWWHCPKGFIVIVGSSVTVATQIVSRATWTLISLNSLIGCFGIVAVIATSLVTLSFTIWLDCLFSALFLLGLVFWFPSFLRVSCYAFVCDRDWAQA